jgi:prevent-host-death family protein
VDLWVFIEGAIGFLSDVTHGGTRLIITFDGKPLGCVVSMEDYQRLQQTNEQKGDIAE